MKEEKGQTCKANAIVGTDERIIVATRNGDKYEREGNQTEDQTQSEKV